MRRFGCMSRIIIAAVIVGAIALLASAARPQTIDRDFKLAAGALVLSSIFDAETTIAGIRSGRAHEANPLARSFVGDGNRAGTYAFVLAGDALVLAIAYRVKKRGDRRWWWLPAAATVAHVAAGGANVRFTN